MSLDSDAKLLGRIRIFSLLEREAIRMLAFQAETIDLRAGDSLFEAGDKSVGGFIVSGGQIAIEDTATQEPGKAGAVKVVEKGGLIGQLALITDVTHRASARAVGEVTILKIQRSSFQRILQEYPDCAAKIRSEIASDLISFTRALEESRQLSG